MSAWGAAPGGQARSTQPPGVFPVGSGPQLTAVQRVELAAAHSRSHWASPTAWMPTFGHGWSEYMLGSGPTHAGRGGVGAGGALQSPMQPETWPGAARRPAPEVFRQHCRGEMNVQALQPERAPHWAQQAAADSAVAPQGGERSWPLKSVPASVWAQFGLAGDAWGRLRARQQSAIRSSRMGAAGSRV